MFKGLHTLMVLLLISTMAAPNALAANQVSINDLIDNTMAYNGVEVAVTGEALGEVMERGEYAWVNISDGTNAIGIWLPLEDARKITYFGDYKNIGDTVQITGIFYRSCTEHGGDIDIHLQNLIITQSGHTVEEQLSSVKIIFGIVLLLIMLFFGYLYFRKMKKSSEKNDKPAGLI